MLGLRLHTLVRTCHKIIVRNYRRSRLVSSRTNPGLDKRLDAFKREGLSVQDDDVEEFIETSESDFAKTGEVYDEYANETLIEKHKLRHRIVKEKYFKENIPNFLTWSEKEQIRHLATTAPDEWTPEKLAESFPVTAPIVRKLLKYPWKPANEQRIARHDTSVLRNWKELKEGSFTIHEDLKKHILKFSNRTIPPISKQSGKINITPEDKEIGEFERIVQRCSVNERNESQQYTETSEEKHQHKTQNDRQRITLNELAKKIQLQMDSGSKIDINDEIIIKTVHNKSSEMETVEPKKEIELSDANDEGKELQKFQSDEKYEKSVMVYPERIRIPKKAYKKGATYKVNDCYYDHDGKFLYRVLGL